MSRLNLLWLCVSLCLRWALGQTQTQNNNQDPNRNPNQLPTNLTKLYMDITIGGRAEGRFTIVLRNDTVPKTAMNFEALCLGTYGYGYKNSKFHRLISGFMVQGGDFTKGDGTGGRSVFCGEPEFEDESFGLNHTKRGLLSMANRGRNTNSAQFFITFAPAAHLNGGHVVFGEVVGDQSLALLNKIERIRTRGENIPNQDIVISDCYADSLSKVPLVPTERPHADCLDYKAISAAPQLASVLASALASALLLNFLIWICA